ncbi:MULTISPECIES: Arc family DNA-binding protein [Pseudomonas syringae group]|uniref:Membrane protein n=1 Tax=Pseudomonas amygdali pv. ulmi TaxID=251720 RepID=A0A0Q0ENJ8_PSEA0|nr:MULTISPECIES: Arc family DNA-binding protein [Pseudomonas syringae group]KPX35951.1 hypothetical protein ALO69_200085 [Pseudomonas ficuserectae]KPZ12459.1 hypothetical protein ALO41_200079 [Pseudomonas amygdali pv. ulmi]PAB28792.1 hypothetical protein CCZ00_20110 [Pseudomonas savastanoi pv. fraxini]RMP38300.1 hypothetical protein ALQ23_200409 [Pseudomonas syringae pv. antirrhini]RMS38523.1 hypothetical protein ALP68_200050 [Pseudomonas ficuserectae]
MNDWQYPLRLPGEMRSVLKAEANLSNRSVNAEIVYRLTRVESLESEVETLKAVIADLTSSTRGVAQ